MDPRFWPGGMGRGIGAGIGPGMPGMGRGMGMPGMGTPNMQQPFYPPQGFQPPYLQQQQAQAQAQAYAYAQAQAQAQQQQQQQQASPPPSASAPPSKDSKYPRFVNPFQDEKPLGSYGKRAYVPGQEAIRIPSGHRGDDPWTNWHMMQARKQLQEMRRSW